MAGRSLAIEAVGAVTPVGLNAEQTCAAFRAGISGIKRTPLRPPPNPLNPTARVPAKSILRKSDRRWLMSLAARAVREVLAKTQIRPDRIAFFLSVPEPYRRHPAFFDGSPDAFLRDLEQQLRVRFGNGSLLLGGHDAPLQALSAADALLDGRVQACLICGVDSLVNFTDIETLSESGRLQDEKNPQGVIPGEGAAAVLLTLGQGRMQPLSVIAGWGRAEESNSVLGDNYSTGIGLARAIADAATSAGVNEPDIAFRVSDMNGERYRAWESFLAATRFYRTHREQLPLHLPAMAVGDVGAAAGVLTLVVAALARSRGYAPGAIACCESSATSGTRAAAIMVPASGAAIPPFRSRHVSS
jgi:hypothetical protein